MDDIGASYSRLGMASFVLALLPYLALAIYAPLVMIYFATKPPGADETGIGFLLFILMLMSVPLEIAALGLGIAGTLRQRDRRLFALMGSVCSSLTLIVLAFYVAP